MINRNNSAPLVSYITPEWPVPENVVAAVSLRCGGSSLSPFDANMALHVGDDAASVQRNRDAFFELLGIDQCSWLDQVHGVEVVEARPFVQQADAVYSREKAIACAVMTADCLPILLCDINGTEVAALHCGWRSLAGGIIAQTVESLNTPAQHIFAWLGPAIGPNAFEVGVDVLAAFAANNWCDETCFTPKSDHKYLADIYGLAKLALNHVGVAAIYGGNFCTVEQSHKFFSYRREPITGRMASVILMR